MLLLVRSHERLARAHLWAEDGSLFLREALERGAAPILEPYAGYLHVLPRILAVLFAQLPLEFFAVTVTTFTLVAYAAMAALFSRRCHRGLVPHDAARILTSAALCFAPGMWEVTGNLANLHSIAFYAAAFIALQDLDRPLGAAELLFIAVVGSTAGELVILAPAFAGRALLRHRAGAQFRYVWPEWAAAALTLGWAAVNVLAFREAVSSFPQTDPVRWFEVAQGTFHTLNTRYLLHPVLGDSLTRSYFRRPLLVELLCAVALLGVLGRGLMRLPSQRRQVLLLVASCVFGLVALTWMVRPWSVREPPFGPVLTTDVFQGRYWFYCAPVAVVLWVAATAALHRWAPRVLCIAIIGLAFPRWELGPFGPEQDWPASARRIQAARGHPGAADRIPINPEGWNISLDSR
ncbi:hypothetical protein [Archangium lansingense]|uniref:Uncharacterized protein n=1 Tax=Archangium lansingense TaxID=2995310 RepID=A0ABT4A8E4_9BACT|nr:hypothetical protein [Archangium lansinium]MCY1077930.1 hypothetical protein [Archangium lansinium]